MIAIIITTNITWRLYRSLALMNDGSGKTIVDVSPTQASLSDFYISKIKIVGKVAPGIDIFYTPTYTQDFASVFVTAIPITLVLFMESYAVARRIAITNNQFHLLSINQEL